MTDNPDLINTMAEHRAQQPEFWDQQRGLPRSDAERPELRQPFRYWPEIGCVVGASLCLILYFIASGSLS